MAKKIPLRQCIGCREMVPKPDLIRVVKTTSGEFAVDATGRMNGRGAYICRNPECLDKAKRSRALERTFKSDIPEDVYVHLSKEQNGDAE